MVHQINSTTDGFVSSYTRNARTRNNASRTTEITRFAHPAEADIAAWLTSNGIRWQYEPTSFPLEVAEDGRLLQCFTPDFFLPDVETYIEMTTMRQALVTRKNQKFRRMRELYPETNVRLLYRRDVELIQRWYGAAGRVSAQLESTPRFGEATIARRTQECIDGLLEQKQGAPLVFSALPGGEAFADRLQMAYNATDSLQSRRKPVQVLVAGAIGTGLTTYNALRQAGPGAMVVTLIDRPGARLIDIPLVFSAFQVSAEWMVGCGLSGDMRPELRTAER